MKYVNIKVSELKIASIGDGSRGWAWGLMGDLRGTQSREVQHLAVHR